MPARTTNAALQQKLDELAAFAAQNNIKAFVEAFVPPDCSADDRSNYLSVLTEDDAEWWEEARTKCGFRVTKERFEAIEGGDWPEAAHHCGNRWKNFWTRKSPPH